MVAATGTWAAELTAVQEARQLADLSAPSRESRLGFQTLMVGNTAVSLPPTITLSFESLGDLIKTDRAKGIELLKKTTREMNRDFPTEERTPPHRFLKSLDRGNYDILVARDGDRIAGVIHQFTLDTPEHGTISAISYVWASSQVRGKGVGTQLCEAGKHLAEAKGAWIRIAEVNDIEIMSRREKREDGGKDRASARERFWNRAGFLQLDMPYLQPQLTADAAPATYPALLAQVLGKPPRTEHLGVNAGYRTLSKDAVIGIVEAYHQEITFRRKADGSGDIDKDLAHTLLKHSIRQGRDQIPLISVHKERSPFDRRFDAYRMERKYPERF